MSLGDPTEQEAILKAFGMGLAEGRALEREAIVKWLRGSGDPVIANWISAQIEAEEHLK